MVAKIQSIIQIMYPGNTILLVKLSLIIFSMSPKEAHSQAINPISIALRLLNQLFFFYVTLIC